MPYLVDSDVLIDISRGNRAARAYLNRLTEGWAISQVSALELMVGARDKEDLLAIETLLSTIVTIPLRGSIGSGAYDLLKRYVKTNGLHLVDSLIAATALEEKLTLVTRNRRHFGMILGLRLDVPTY